MFPFHFLLWSRKSLFPRLSPGGCRGAREREEREERERLRLSHERVEKETSSGKDLNEEGKVKRDLFSPSNEIRNSESLLPAKLL